MRRGATSLHRRCCRGLEADWAVRGGMSVRGRRDATHLPPAFLHKEADSVYHVRSWLNEIGIPDAHIRAEEQPAGGAIHSPDKMDLYLPEECVIIEVKRQRRLSMGPYERGTGSSRNESAHEQVGRHVADERCQWRFYSTAAWARANRGRPCGAPDVASPLWAGSPARPAGTGCRTLRTAPQGRVACGRACAGGRTRPRTLSRG